MAPPVDQVLKRQARMESDRGNFESNWQDVRNYLRPDHGSIIGEDVSGSLNRDLIMDTTGEDASLMFSAGMHGMLTNPGTVWFQMRAEVDELNELDEVRLFTEVARNRLLAIFASPRTMFDTSIVVNYQDCGDFGTTVLYIGDRPGDLPLYQVVPINEVYIADGPEGRVDTVHRKFKLTADQAVRKFNQAGDTLPEAITRAAANPDKMDDQFTFLHVVMPRESRIAGIGARNMPFASLWIAVDQKHLIRESGFQSQAYIVWRWWQRAGERYGRGPGMKALPDVKTLQRGVRVTMRAAEKATDPSLMVADDGVMSPVRNNASGITYVSQELLFGRQAPIQPLLSGANPQLGEDYLDRVRARIERAYFNNLLTFSQDPKMTATQALILDEKTMTLLGPFLGRAQNEFLGPIIQRTFELAQENGLLPPVPAVLDNEHLKVEYVSPVAKAQRLSEATAVARWYEIMAAAAQYDQDVFDTIDADEAGRIVADRLGVPRMAIRTQDGIVDLRERRSQRQAGMDEAETMKRLAAAYQAGGQGTAAFAGAARTVGADGDLPEAANAA